MLHFLLHIEAAVLKHVTEFLIGGLRVLFFYILSSKVQNPTRETLKEGCIQHKYASSSSELSDSRTVVLEVKTMRSLWTSTTSIMRNNKPKSLEIVQIRWTIVEYFQLHGWKVAS